MGVCCCTVTFSRSVKGTWPPHYLCMDRYFAFAVPCMFDTSSEPVEKRCGALLV